VIYAVDLDLQAKYFPDRFRAARSGCQP
jgi:hypothetical protein